MRENFLVAREEMADFQWSDLKRKKKCWEDEKGGMPEMVFEYILKEKWSGSGKRIFRLTRALILVLLLQLSPVEKGGVHSGI